MRFENKTLYIERSDVEKTAENFAAAFRCFLHQDVLETDKSVPSWVQRVVKHLNEHIFMHLHDAATESEYRMPYKSGYICGIMRWAEEFFGRQFDTLFKKLETLEQHFTIVQECTDKEAEDIWDQAFSKAGLDDKADEEGDLTKTILRLMRKAFLRMSVNDGAEFFQGMADGFRGLDQRGTIYGKANLSTPIMIDLWLYWPMVSQMHSINELYRWLCKLEGKQKIGEYKRVEKICQRLDLTLRRRGRPPKSEEPKNTDTATKA